MLTKILPTPHATMHKARTLIVAADAETTGGGGGWFDKPKSFSTMSERSLKRVLNAAMKLRANKKEPQPLRVVALCKATKESKGIASILTDSGDGQELSGGRYQAQKAFTRSK